jgi:hypothetical protein
VEEGGVDELVLRVKKQGTCHVRATLQSITVFQQQHFRPRLDSIPRFSCSSFSNDDHYTMPPGFKNYKKAVIFGSLKTTGR